MAVSTSKVLRLTFTTAGGGSFAITLPNPKEDLQLTEVMTVMNSLITSDIFLTPGGALTGVRDVKVIGTVTNDLYDSPQA